mmetsp:Transcript_38017/g.95579  ORF Transcript_38017/g.95579 Transcript_38017/m.95579 type:complete len:222 (+) Transcript_38017:590-1255(+)
MTRSRVATASSLLEGSARAVVFFGGAEGATGAECMDAAAIFSHFLPFLLFTSSNFFSRLSPPSFPDTAVNKQSIKSTQSSGFTPSPSLCDGPMMSPSPNPSTSGMGPSCLMRRIWSKFEVPSQIRSMKPTNFCCKVDQISPRPRDVSSHGMYGFFKERVDMPAARRISWRSTLRRPTGRAMSLKMNFHEQSDFARETRFLSSPIDVSVSIFLTLCRYMCAL